MFSGVPDRIGRLPIHAAVCYDTGRRNGKIKPADATHLRYLQRQIRVHLPNPASALKNRGFELGVMDCHPPAKFRIYRTLVSDPRQYDAEGNLSRRLAGVQIVQALDGPVVRQLHDLLVFFRPVVVE